MAASDDEPDVAFHEPALDDAAETESESGGEASAVKDGSMCSMFIPLCP